jgi:hypothetical protein
VRQQGGFGDRPHALRHIVINLRQPVIERALRQRLEAQSGWKIDTN